MHASAKDSKRNVCVPMSLSTEQVLSLRVQTLVEENKRLKLVCDALRNSQMEQLVECRQRALLRYRGSETKAALAAAHAEIDALKKELRKREDECHAVRTVLRRKNASVATIAVDDSPAAELQAARRQLTRVCTENEGLRTRLANLQTSSKPLAERQLSVSELDTSLVKNLKTNTGSEQHDSDEYGIALMEQLAAGIVSPINEYDDDDITDSYGYYNDENMCEPDARDREIDLLEHFLHDEHRLRVRSEQRSLQLMQILDDRVRIENVRVKEEREKRLALQISLDSVRRALAAERDARNESNAHIADALRRATKIQQQLCGDLTLPELDPRPSFTSGGHLHTE